MNHWEHGEKQDLKDCDEDLIDKVLTAVTRVHRQLGPGLFESVYELATMLELEELRIPARRQVEIPVRYLSRTYGETNISRWHHGWLLVKMTLLAAVRLKFV